MLVRIIHYNYTLLFLWTRSIAGGFGGLPHLIAAEAVFFLMRCVVLSGLELEDGLDELCHFNVRGWADVLPEQVRLA